MRWTLVFIFLGLAAQAECPANERFRFDKFEAKLNLNGTGPLDAVARFTADDGDDTYVRRALLIDAAESPVAANKDQWIESCHSTESTEASPITFEKVSVGEKDLLFVSEESNGGGTFQYFTADGAKPKPALRYHNNQLAGQFNESHKGGKLALRIVGDGDLDVGGQSVDLDQRAIKLRCRVRELQVQINYEWDRKAGEFKETDSSCVMGSAID